VDGPWYHGEEPKQGKRSDLLNLHDALKKGMSEAEIANDESLFPLWARNFKVIGRFKALQARSTKRAQPEVIIYWGPTGVRKTTRLVYEVPSDAYWVKRPGSNQTTFFDNYENQEVVVFDEFEGAWFKIAEMLSMVSCHPLQLDTKGGFCYFTPKKIYFTSNLDPREWWANANEAHREAWLRRLNDDTTHVVHMTETWYPPSLVVETPGMMTVLTVQSEAGPTRIRSDKASALPTGEESNLERMNRLRLEEIQRAARGMPFTVHSASAATGGAAAGQGPTKTSAYAPSEKVPIDYDELGQRFGYDSDFSEDLEIVEEIPISDDEKAERSNLHMKLTALQEAQMSLEKEERLRRIKDVMDVIDEEDDEM